MSLAEPPFGEPVLAVPVIVEDPAQLLHHGSLDSFHHVVPRMQVFRPHIHPADERDLPVDDHELGVI